MATDVVTSNTAPTLTFQTEGKDIVVHLDSPENTVWATVSDVARLFDCTTQNVELHIKNLYREEEINEIGTTKLFLVVRQEGARSVERAINHYNLDVILSVGYRINSKKATAFRRWATERLKEYLVRGYAIDEDRIKDDPEALKALAQKLRAIRTGEKAMYQKVCDVFKISSSDYDAGAQAARTFFAMAQDKFHYAVTGKTAAEIILERADATKPNMGLVNFNGKSPSLDDAKIGKNYLKADELYALENICEQFLLFAESKAFRGHKMTMEELSFKLNTLLTANDYQVLYQYDRYKRGAADEHAKEQLGAWKAKQVVDQRRHELQARAKIGHAKSGTKDKAK